MTCPDERVISRSDPDSADHLLASVESDETVRLCTERGWRVVESALSPAAATLSRGYSQTMHSLSAGDCDQYLQELYDLERAGRNRISILEKIGERDRKLRKAAQR